ncbi:hypothetical protein [Streptomyces roseolilacinus]|uniref:Uncharacterized protein n=1 Tax=Streptomyces roseolilacinus TaxID=66904 RepID=A0A918AW55_9ACTN|nr:hypothetical protein [Streptomyces roseolilacinus]GGP91527.1 hypothetical protein GCM10010249_06940 [Streptomyces roseolilacinus]
MVEGEECSPPAGDGAGDSRTGHEGPPAGDPARDPAAGRPAADEPPSPPDDLPGLLGLLGRLLEDHAPEEIAVLLREEVERREFTAYAHGWRDAALHFAPLVEEARGGRSRPLRLVDRTHGPGSVIPFPRDRHLPYAADPDPRLEGGGRGVDPVTGGETGVRGDTAAPGPAPHSAGTPSSAPDDPPGATTPTGTGGSGAPAGLPHAPAPKRSAAPAAPDGSAASDGPPGTRPASGAPGAPPTAGPAASGEAPQGADGPEAPDADAPEGPDVDAPEAPAPEAPTPDGSGAGPSSAPRHAFAPKSRTSKVPTIPKIVAPRRPRRGQTGGRPRQPSVPGDEGA